MVDTYQNYDDLASNEIIGRDYLIRSANLGSEVLVLAPHAGGIFSSSLLIILLYLPEHTSLLIRFIE